MLGIICSLICCFAAQLYVGFVCKPLSNLTSLPFQNKRLEPEDCVDENKVSAIFS